MFQKIKYTQLTSRDFIKKRVIIKELNAKITFGLEDAAKTGIATGAVWALIYNIFALITKFATVSEHKFDVEPDYNNECFSASLNGIITVKIVNIISIALYVFVKYMTVSNKYEQKIEEGV